MKFAKFIEILTFLVFEIDLHEEEFCFNKSSLCVKISDKWWEKCTDKPILDCYLS